MVDFEWEELDNPTQRVTLKNVSMEEELEDRQSYKSPLGNYSLLQENIIMFGRSGHMIFISILYVISFISLSITMKFTDIYEVPILYTLFQMINSVLLMIGILSITIGSYQLNKKWIVSGLDIINLVLTFGFVLLLIVVVAFGALLTFQFFVSAAVAIITGILLGLLFYFFISFYKSVIDFVRDCSQALRTLPNNKVSKPNALKIHKFLSVLFYLSLLQIPIVMFQFFEPFLVNTIENADPLFLLVYAIVYSSMLLYLMYLCKRFDNSINHDLHVSKEIKNG
jgi:hypothetical protein